MQQQTLFDSSVVGAAIAAPPSIVSHLLISGSNGVISRALVSMNAKLVNGVTIQTISLSRFLRQIDIGSVVSQTLALEVVSFRQRPEALAQFIAEKQHRTTMFVGFYSDERSRKKFESWVAEYTRIYGAFRNWTWYDINADGRGAETKEDVVRRIVRARMQTIRISS